MYRSWIYLLVITLCLSEYAQSIQAQSAGGLAAATTPINYAPVAFPQLVQLTDFNAVTINLAGIDANNDALTFTLASAPQLGSVGPLDPATGQIQYTPAAGLATADSFTFSVSDGLLSSETVTITILPPQPAAVLSAASLDFGNQPNGMMSSSRVFTIQSGSVLPLNIQVMQFGGPNSADFGLDLSGGTCPSTPPLQLGQTCTMAVNFTPGGVGARSATLLISDNAPDSPQVVSLAGVGVGPIVALSASSLAFANQGVGTPSAPQTATLQNTGNADLSISSIALGGTNSADFVATNTCGALVVAGGNCTISVIFNPTAVGSRSATVAIQDGLGTQTVDVAGTGIGLLALSASTLSFGNQGLGSTSGTKKVTLKNSNVAAFHLTSMNIAGTNGSDFSKAGTTCGSILAGHVSCTVSVTYMPSILGNETASLTFTDDAGNSPQVVSLTGNGVPQATLSVSSITFGNQATGTASSSKTLTLTNNTSSSTPINGISTEGTNASDFTVLNTTCGTDLGGHTSCKVSITFSPSATGVRSALLTVADGASNSPQSASLSGTGVVPVAVTPAGLTYSSLKVGTVSAMKTVTIRNNLPTVLTIGGLAITGQNSGDFVNSSSTCGPSVAAGASCSVKISFAPSAIGTRNATFTISDDASSSPQSATLTGVGK